MRKNLIIGIIASFAAASFLGAACEQNGDDTGDGLSPYAGEVFNVSSDDGKVEGVIAVGKKSTPDNIRAEYHLLIHDDLPANGLCGVSGIGCGDSAAYEYIGKLIYDVNQDYDGLVSEAYCNETVLPEDPFEPIQSQMYSWEACGNDPMADRTPVSDFYLGFTEFYDSIEELKTAKGLQIVDSSPYWEITEISAEGVTSASINTDLAHEEGEVVRTYSMNIKEKQ